LPDNSFWFLLVNANKRANENREILRNFLLQPTEAAAKRELPRAKGLFLFCNSFAYLLQGKGTLSIACSQP